MDLFLLISDLKNNNYSVLNNGMKRYISYADLYHFHETKLLDYLRLRFEWYPMTKS
jgi:hypothetical protein